MIVNTAEERSAHIARLLLVAAVAFACMFAFMHAVPTQAYAKTNGWKIQSGKLYYYDSGKKVCNDKVDGLVLTKDGSAKSCTATSLKIKTMKTLDRITKKSDSRATKLHKAFNWCISMHFSPSSRPSSVTKSGWVQRHALTAMSQWKGNCESMASCFACFAYELGYSPTIRVKHYVHAYVIINGRAYDNMLAKGGYGGKVYTINGANDWIFKNWSSVTNAKYRTGVEKSGSKITYFKNGKQVKSKWVTINGKRYYFNKKGYAVTGLTKIKGVYYLFSSKGALMKGSATRYVTYKGVKYKVRASGKVFTGWNSEKTEYCSKKGVSYKGVSLISGELYVFGDSGMLDSEKTAALREVAVQGTALSLIAEVAGEPKSIAESKACDGTGDIVYEYRYSHASFFGIKHLTDEEPLLDAVV